MNDSKSFQKIVGVCAVLVTLFIIGNVVTLFASVKDNTAVFSDAELLLPLGFGSAQVFHVSMVFDVFAYLLFAPVVLFCRSWLRDRSQAWVSLYTFCGLAYCLLGALGAVIVDAVLPRMMVDYSLADPARQEILKSLARYVYLAVAHGIWNPLEVLMVSVWFLAVGLLLRRERRGLGILALVVSILGLLDPVGWMLQNDIILNIGGIGTVLLPVWTAWFGIVLLRNRGLISTETGSRHAGQIEGLA